MIAEHGARWTDSSNPPQHQQAEVDHGADNKITSTISRLCSIGRAPNRCPSRQPGKQLATGAALLCLRPTCAVGTVSRLLCAREMHRPGPWPNRCRPRRDASSRRLCLLLAVDLALRPSGGRQGDTNRRKSRPEGPCLTSPPIGCPWRYQLDHWRHRQSRYLFMRQALAISRS